ncbi:MAG: leucyl/phenylalanyl-tRNA--protein transferase [Pseudomarimonas sp.]
MPIFLPQLDRADDATFPPCHRALCDPNGLLAFGGDLSSTRLLNAYRNGIFPWYSEGEPILWWSPDPRMVIAPTDLHLSRRLLRSLARCDWQIRADFCFEQVIDVCASVPRHGRVGTWITAEMRDAYVALHRLGHAHSIEVIDGDGRLVGGLYGVAIGRIFFGESMFSLHSGGSQVAIAGLCRRLTEWNYALLDGQVESAHLATLGFRPQPRATFVAICAKACAEPEPAALWHSRFDHIHAQELA